MPPQSEDGVYSSLGLKAHRSRGDHFRGLSGDLWLQEKSEYDGAEGLWRIHDNLYDLSDFIDTHPGGAMWLNLTKGTDITEAFETHHVSLVPERLLPKFQVHPATTPRNSPFTFKEDEFYKTLKKHIQDEIKTIPSSAAKKSKLISDSLFLSCLIFAILATKYWNYYLGTLAGVSLHLLAVAAHNFFHQKDSFRMYYFDLSGMSSREWRISHVLSHHLYTNTIIDLQISICEPLLQFFPINKNWIVKYGNWIYGPVFYALYFGINYLKRIYLTAESLAAGRSHEIEKKILIPLIIPAVMYLTGGQLLGPTLLMWLYIISVASFLFLFNGINTGHHAPDNFHDGDTSRGKTVDWGISQLDTVMDREEIVGSLFLGLTNFGDHGLHHLFPTVDHGKLIYLYPTFNKVCKMFDVELRMASQFDMIKNTFIQLAKDVPNPLPPGHKKTN